VVLLFDILKPLPFPWSFLNRIVLFLMRRTQYIKLSIQRTENSSRPEDTKMVENYSD